MIELPTIYIREPIITDDGRAYSLMRDPTPGAVAYVPASRLAAAEAERDAAVQRADRRAAQLAGAREATGIVGANADAIVDALRADLARVTQERDEARAQVEAMKPRVIAAPPMQFDDDSEPVAAAAPTPSTKETT